jgi:hypothetical protein
MGHESHLGLPESLITFSHGFRTRITWRGADFRAFISNKRDDAARAISA